MELVNLRLGSDYKEEEAMVMIKVALLCTNVTALIRSTMSSIMTMSEGRIAIEDVVTDSSEVLDEKKLEAMRQYYQQIQEETKTSESARTRSMTIEGPWIGSSSSTVDLYPVNFSSYS